MIDILPSIASANQADLSGQIASLKNHTHLHFDIEDGNFVPNITFGMKTVRALRPLSQADFDAHLMVTHPMDYIPDLIKLNFRAIAFHWESTGYPLQVVRAIQDGGSLAGIALNPRTPVQELLPYLSFIDYVLIMTSEPDGRGDQFQPNMLEKFRVLRAAAPELPLVADGGIDASTLSDVVSAGATAIVMGRAVFSASDPYAAIQSFLHQ